MTHKVFRYLKTLLVTGYYLLVAFPLVVSAAQAQPTQLTLLWDANDPAPQGYNLYQRVEGESYNYNTPVNQGLITGSTFTVEALQYDMQYYFVVRAVVGGDMSGDSNEVQFMAPGLVDDTDGDGYHDGMDAFPNDDTEWLDTDNDGVGNNTDADDDDDGMPDAYEVQYGLNPLADDANGDLDGDGISNLTEYNNGSDPANVEGNNPPSRPYLIAPANGAVNVNLAPTLLSGGFDDQDGDTHARTQYQIAVGTDWDNLSDADFVFDAVFENKLTELTLVDLILEAETTYYWRVRFIDSHNGVSEWSATAMFATGDNLTAGYLDDDGDGILNSQEVDSGAINLDAEITEDLLVIGSSDNHNPQLGIVFSSNADMVSLRSIDSNAIDALNAPEILTGLISFKLRLLSGETTANVTVYLSQPAPENARWYKYNMDIGWVPNDFVSFGPDRKSVTFLLVDGGFGDDDGVQNGLIVDPSGLGYSSGGSGSSLGYSSQISDVSSSSDGSGGGCFISISKTEPIGNFRHVLYLLIVGMLVLTIMLFIKCRKVSRNL